MPARCQRPIKRCPHTGEIGSIETPLVEHPQSSDRSTQVVESEEVSCTDAGGICSGLIGIKPWGLTGEKNYLEGIESSRMLHVYSTYSQCNEAYDGVSMTREFPTRRKILTAAGTARQQGVGREQQAARRQRGTAGLRILERLVLPEAVHADAVSTRWRHLPPVANPGLQRGEA